MPQPRKTTRQRHKAPDTATQTPKKKPKTGNKQHMLFRYSLVVSAFVLFALVISVKLFYVTIVKAQLWNDRAALEMSRVKIIDPERGNILAANGNILACDITVYDIKVDLRHPKIKKYKIDSDSIDALADSLDLYYPRYPEKIIGCTNADTLAKYSWRTVLDREMIATKFEDRRRSLTLVKHGNMSDYDRILTFPIFRGIKGKGDRHPVYAEKKSVRQRPFGKMAARSIGRVNEDSITGKVHGYSGLEKDLDSLLYGIPGQSRPVALTGGMHQMPSTPAIRGYDVLTTIDIDIQDILEEELTKVCRESNAQWGTAIIMEVSTGEIKAISNVERLKDGTYGESLNRAVMAFEPGSVMKPISLMIAFEDGAVKNVTDGVDTSPFQQTTDKHKPPFKTMKQVIAYSSNTGIARVIFRKYENNPEKFYDRLASIGFFEPMHTGIAGEQIPRIRRLTDKDNKGNNITMTARHLDLARQAYGYNTEIPPMYTLSYYNAIANGGEYIRPHLVKVLRREGEPDSILPVHKQRVCSENTARMVRECIYEVVWDDHGTGRRVRDDRVVIAGKTGTAFPVFEKETKQKGYDMSRRRYAFAGFFPYDKPKYSCIALVLAPAGNSAAATSGQVLKNVAVKLFARGWLGQEVSYATERVPSAPTVHASNIVKPGEVINQYNLPNAKVLATKPPMPPGKMPDVTGYDIGSALNILEKAGLNVSVQGWGYVVSQSIPPGQDIKQGDRVVLQLQN